MKKSLTLAETATQLGIANVLVIEMIELEWIVPMAEQFFDEEDIARIQLILDLRNQFGANDEAIPLILHLVDQLCHLKCQMGKMQLEG